MTLALYLLVLAAGPTLDAHTQELKVYTTYTGGPRATLTLLPLGARHERRMLAHLDAAGLAEHDTLAVYEGRCETTACQKIYYQEVGGTRRLFVTESGSFGDYLALTLSGRTEPLALGYDEKKSRARSAQSLLQRYLDAVGRLERGTMSGPDLAASLQRAGDHVAEACGTRPQLQLSVADFETARLSHLVGMAQHVAIGIATACGDPDYREVLGTLRTIRFVPGPASPSMRLDDPHALRIFLGPATFNPTVEARTWLEGL